MLFYLLKSAACLVILLFFYKILLEKENMHVFKRFFLLGALIFAFVVPVVVFTEYIKVAPIANATVETSPISHANMQQETVTESFDFKIMFLGIYALGVLFFGIIFLKNLFQILTRIRRNPKQINSKFIHVLLLEKLPPHTFLKYVFLNKTKFEENNIPQEVLLHEETHARQMHTLDVLLIELLQVIFWFNPMFYFYKKAIKLNHEFLADQAVLNSKIDTVTYQKTLLSFLSSSNDSEQQTVLSSAINYSSIKKRFTIMKTKTSKKTVVLRSLLLLPLLAAMLYGFSESRIVETYEMESEIDKTNNENSFIQKGPTKKDLYYEKVTFKFRDSNLKVIAVKTYHELSEEHKSRLDEPISSPSKNHPTRSQLDNWTTSNQFGIWLDDIQVENKVLNDYTPEDIYIYYLSKLEKNATNYGKHFFQVNLYTKTGFSKILKNASQPLSKDITIYLKAEDLNFNKNKNQATKEEIHEYNSLAKKYNAMFEGDHFTIRMPDVERIKELYNLMTETQRTNAEPFPDFPEPPAMPAPPTPPNTAKEVATNIKNAQDAIAVQEHFISEQFFQTDFPAAPNLAYRISDKPLSNKVQKAINTFVKQKKKYHLLIDKQLKNKTVDQTKIETSYNKLLEAYDDYKVQAMEEGVFAQASPAFGRKIKLQSPKAPAKSPKPPTTKNLSDKAFAEKQIEAIVDTQDPYDNVGIRIDSRTNKLSYNINSSYTPPKPQTTPKAKNYVNISATPEDTTNRLREELKSNRTNGDIFAVETLSNEFYINTPPPPTSPNPVDLAIKLAKQEATFFYKNKKVSSEKAIQILKKNKDLSMQVSTSEDEKPIVKIDTHF
ncbi:hypothetical protein GH721_08720 [Kriegella sp. EG-1]|nr:hypothetical protein [Flavobacteriaceae bacterium EG-1]